MKILTRIRQLEQRRTESHGAIFYEVFDTEPHCFSFDHDGQRVNVLRLTDETEANFRTRAAGLCRIAQKRKTVMLFQMREP
jgi:hypothetical protein